MFAIELSFCPFICYATEDLLQEVTVFQRNSMNADLLRRTDEVVTRLTQLRDSL
jgi:hypothetical protein